MKIEFEVDQRSNQAPEKIRNEQFEKTAVIERLFTVLLNKQGWNEKENEDGPSAYYIIAEIVLYIGMGCYNAQHGEYPADVNPDNTPVRFNLLCINE